MDCIGTHKRCRDDVEQSLVRTGRSSVVLELLGLHKDIISVILSMSTLSIRDLTSFSMTCRRAYDLTEPRLVERYVAMPTCEELHERLRQMRDTLATESFNRLNDDVETVNLYYPSRVSEGEEVGKVVALSLVANVECKPQVRYVGLNNGELVSAVQKTTFDDVLSGIEPQGWVDLMTMLTVIFTRGPRTAYMSLHRRPLREKCFKTVKRYATKLHQVLQGLLPVECIALVRVPGEALAGAIELSCMNNYSLLLRLHLAFSGWVNGETFGDQESWRDEVLNCAEEDADPATLHTAVLRMTKHIRTQLQLLIDWNPLITRVNERELHRPLSTYEVGEYLMEMVVTGEPFRVAFLLEYGLSITLLCSDGKTVTEHRYDGYGEPYIAYTVQDVPSKCIEMLMADRDNDFGLLDPFSVIAFIRRRYCREPSYARARASYHIQNSVKHSDGNDDATALVVDRLITYFWARRGLDARCETMIRGQSLDGSVASEGQLTIWGEEVHKEYMKALNDLSVM